MPELQVETTREGNYATVAFVGSLEAATLPQSKAILDWLQKTHEGGASINLYECEYIDQKAVERLMEVRKVFHDQARPFVLYVRPMSFVAHRTNELPQAQEVPPSIARAGEGRLAEKRSARLAQWRAEKPIQSLGQQKVPTPAAPKKRAEKKTPVEQPPADPELIPLDYIRLATLAGKDERVINRILETYSSLLEQGGFSTATDGRGDTQLSLDAKRVAFELRLDPRLVRTVIESINSQISDALSAD